MKELKLNSEEWQKGEHSSLKPLERVELMNAWLKEKNKEIKESKSDSTSTDDETTIGFIDI